MLASSWLPKTLVLVLAASATAQDQTCLIGAVEDSFNHTNTGPYTVTGWPATFNAFHSSVIPSGPFQGWIVAWMPMTSAGASPGYQFWSLIKPETDAMGPRQFWNFQLDTTDETIGETPRDLACAGHCWLPDGRLFVAGGTENYSPIVGSNTCWIFDPFNNPGLGTPPGSNMWIRQTNKLEIPRWYPSCTLFRQNFTYRVFVSGGGATTACTPAIGNNYEVFVPGSAPFYQGGFDKHGAPLTQIYCGSTFANSNLGVYPRVHALSNGQLFVSSMYQQATALVYDPNTPAWYLRGDSGTYREYGASLLAPNTSASNQDAAIILGGSSVSASAAGAMDTVLICKASASIAGGFEVQGYTWTGMPQMNRKRYNPNAVVMPDATILVFGGEGPAVPQYWLELERYKGGGWTLLANLTSPRGYHSTAVLLPSGKVLVAGGDVRTWDYEIFVTPEIKCLPPPTFGTPPLPPVLNYDPTADPLLPNWITIGYGGLPAGTYVTKVVLMRPGSTTHHSDFDQRYVQLQTELLPGNQVRFRAPYGHPDVNNPLNANAAPQGFYMVFLMADNGAYSVAAWVEVR